MTLVNTRAAFEKAVTDAVSDIDPTVLIVYDNVAFTTPGKTKKYIVMSINFGQSTIQNQGSASSYYSGFIQCNIYVPRSKGSAVLSNISEAIIDGLISVNASDYVDTFTCSPRVSDIVGPGPILSDEESHFLGVISCQFSANA